MTKLLMAIMASAFALTALAQAPGTTLAPAPYPAAATVTPAAAAPRTGVETPKVKNTASATSAKPAAKKVGSKAKKKPKKQRAPTLTRTN